MESTLTIAPKIITLPQIKMTMGTTVIQTIVRSASLPLTDITAPKQEYTDKQFHADLKKASKWVAAMEEEALKEDAEGKTRKFPA